MPSSQRLLLLATVLLAIAYGPVSPAADPPAKPHEKADAAKAPADKPGPRKLKAQRRAAAGEGPWYVDDEKFTNDFYDKLTALAKQGKCLAAKEIHARPGGDKCHLTLAKPGTEPLAPEEVYRRALPSVFVIGSVVESEHEKGKWDTAGMGTAWAVTDDGVMATNAHLFAVNEKECFGVSNHCGEVFPVVAVLGTDPIADIALIRVAGKGFAPLPVAMDEPVGAWIGVLSHPGGLLFSFTQGYVTRYMYDVMDGKEEWWMCVSADYAVGSSGAPVLNRFGAVVGMATLTSNIDAEDQPEPEGPKPPAAAPEKAATTSKTPAAATKTPEPEPKAEPPSTSTLPPSDLPKASPKDESKDHPRPKGPDDPPAKADVEPSTLQMVVKLVVPGRVIRDFCSGKPNPASEGEKHGGAKKR